MPCGASPRRMPALTRWIPNSPITLAATRLVRGILYSSAFRPLPLLIANLPVRAYKMPMTDRMHLPVPGSAERVLLHSCCAPCSGEVMEAMQASGLDLTIYFYNPNIHPREEY